MISKNFKYQNMRERTFVDMNNNLLYLKKTLETSLPLISIFFDAA